MEAGRRCVALRMDASYPLANGSKDVHRAFVVATAGASPRNIEARPYTDRGAVRDYSVRVYDGSLQFDDIPSGHVQNKRARKTLTPRDDGFEERLEVEDTYD